MWERLLHEIQWVHAILAVLAALGFFAFWIRTRLWLPKYIHVIAAISMLLGLLVGWLISIAPKLPPPSGPPPLVGILFPALLFPALVYFFFIFYGGQHAAFRRSAHATAPCPSCKIPLPAHIGENEVRFLEPECTSCGQSLSSDFL
jgi:hypothetical protein